MEATLAQLTVESVGGKFIHNLGKSTIQVQIKRCTWEGKQYVQREFRREHLVPARAVSVQVVKIQDENDTRKNAMWEFFQGTSP